LGAPSVLRDLDALRPCSEIQPWNGDETLLPGLALCCLFCSTSVARRQAIRVDCIKVFPISIVELSQGYVNDCGSDCVGGEGYSANVFVRSSLLYLSTVGIVQAFFALEEALALHISCTNFLATHS